MRLFLQGSGAAESRDRINQPIDVVRFSFDRGLGLELSQRLGGDGADAGELEIWRER